MNKKYSFDIYVMFSKKKLLLVIIELFFSFIGYSQSCLPDGINFTTQAQIDNFQINYPNCTEIEGDVNITGDDITNLNGLNVLSCMGRYCWISSNPILTNLSGLNNLDSIGCGLTIKLNPSITSLEGLNKLTYIGCFLDIHQNDALTSLSGLNNLNYIGGNLNIYENALLTNLTGLDGVDTISGGLILGWGFFDNPSMTSLDGLENLSFLGGILNISGNPVLENISALNNLTSIDGFVLISANPVLASLAGLENISCIQEELDISFNYALKNLNELENLEFVGDYINISYNDSLNSLMGLQNLTYCADYIDIYNNQNLTSLAGLDNIVMDSITSLYLRNNSNLSNCAVQSVCEYLVNPNANASIYNNATGCDSQEEVETACEVGLNDLSTGECNFIIYPNPASITITIATTKLLNHSELAILNLNGQALDQYRIKERRTVIDMSHLKAGIYFFRLTSDSLLKMFKIVKI